MAAMHSTSRRQTREHFVAQSMPSVGPAAPTERLMSPASTHDWTNRPAGVFAGSVRTASAICSTVSPAGGHADGGRRHDRHRGERRAARGGTLAPSRILNSSDIEARRREAFAPFHFAGPAHAAAGLLHLSGGEGAQRALGPRSALTRYSGSSPSARASSATLAASLIIATRAGCSAYCSRSASARRLCANGRRPVPQPERLPPDAHLGPASWALALAGLDGFRGCATVVREALPSESGLFVLGLVGASFASARVAGRFTPRRPRGCDIAAGFTGGLLMGWG